MSIKIDEEKCIACGKCNNICPGNLISKNLNGKAEIIEKDKCWGCLACMKECPVRAINYSLRDSDKSFITLKKEKDSIKWLFNKEDIEEEIEINLLESNKY